MTFHDLFSNKLLIACIHLMPLPGAPHYNGDIEGVYNKALEEAHLFKAHGVDALIIENFRDKPFYPGRRHRI